MKQPDADQYINAMTEESQAHEDNHHWEVVSRDVIPHGTPILPALWARRRNRCIATQAIYKWKQEHGINYWETFSPVVRWSTIRLAFVLAIQYQWATHQLDFVTAYHQAPAECDLYMEVP
jgi:Reverse transcriptase (RNA-dependent DNA polymerase)